MSKASARDTPGEAPCPECDGPTSCMQIRWCTRYGRVVSSPPSATLGEALPTPDLLRLMIEAGFNAAETHPQSIVHFSTLKFAKLLKEYFALSETPPKTLNHAILADQEEEIRLLRAELQAARELYAKESSARSAIGCSDDAELFRIIQQYGIRWSKEQPGSDPAQPYYIHLQVDGVGQTTCHGVTPRVAAERALAWLKAKP